MRTNRQGLDLIKGFESCQLEAYPDPVSPLHRACMKAKVNPLNGGYRNLSGWDAVKADPWTIGYGNTGPDVTQGQVITAQEAEELLARRLAAEFEPGVARLLPGGATGNQFSALVCFAYNVGLGNLAKSTLLRKLLAGDAAGAASEFPKWNKSGGQVLNGLVKRRAAEMALFLTPGDGDPV